MSKYTVTTTNAFVKGVQRCAKRGYDTSLPREVITLLADTGSLPEKYKPHKLSGNFAGAWGMPHTPRLVAYMATK